MAQIEKNPGRAHGAEGTSGDDIHLTHRSRRAQLIHEIWHLLSRNNAGRAVANAFVDLR